MQVEVAVQPVRIVPFADSDVAAIVAGRVFVWRRAADRLEVWRWAGDRAAVDPLRPPFHGLVTVESSAAAAALVAAELTGLNDACRRFLRVQLEGARRVRGDELRPGDRVRDAWGWSDGIVGALHDGPVGLVEVQWLADDGAPAFARRGLRLSPAREMRVVRLVPAW